MKHDSMGLEGGGGAGIGAGMNSQIDADANSGAAALSSPVARAQKFRSICSSQPESRIRKFSWLIRCERVNSE